MHGQLGQLHQTCPQRSADIAKLALCRSPQTEKPQDVLEQYYPK